MNKLSKEEETVITQMINEVMEEEYGTLEELDDDYDDCDEDVCSCCGCEVNSSQWLILLDTGEFAVCIEDEDGSSYMKVLEPVPNAAGLFKEHPKRIYTLSDIIDHVCSPATLPIFLKRVSFTHWAVMEGQECS